jgi:hypothetical protein
MDWPSIFDVKAARSQQLFEWHRWLESPKTLEQDGLWMRIEERCKEMGIFEGPAYKKLCQDATAHHEAGHAVIAIALGVPISHVEIFSDQDGKCYYAKSPSTEDENKNAVVCSRAGQWAEAQISARGFCLRCSEEDNHKAERLLNELCEGKTRDYRQWLEQQLHHRVVEEVEKNRHSIMRVAEKLRTVRKLRCDQIYLGNV